MNALIKPVHGRRSAPVDVSLPFRGLLGWIGGVCPCGSFTASGRSPEAMWAGLTDHQESTACSWGAARRVDEAEAAM